MLSLARGTSQPQAFAGTVEPVAQARHGADERIVPALFGTDRPSRGLLKMLLAGALTAALLGSGPLLEWTEQQSGMPAGPAAQQLSSSWNDAMRCLGLTAMHATLRHGIRALEATHFPSAGAGGG
ncbi:MAG: hypothetical protein M3Y41_08560 [Pseudomonadota bacterium]|nr:hypothetical protein [Pseudomonadota bacterium]